MAWGSSLLDDYTTLLDEGPPFPLDTLDPDQQAENRKWRDAIKSARDKHKAKVTEDVGADFATKGLDKVFDASSLTGSSSLDDTLGKIRTSTLGALFGKEREREQTQKLGPRAPLPELLTKPSFKPGATVLDTTPPTNDVRKVVVGDDVLAGQVEASLKGLDDVKRYAALRVYDVTKAKTGDSQEAFRRLLMAQGVLTGNVSQDAWLLMEADAFGPADPNRANRYGPIFREFQALSGEAPSPIEGELDPLRTAILNAYTADLSSEDKQFLFNVYSDTLQGTLWWSPDNQAPAKPGTPETAFAAFKASLGELHGNIRAVGPLALTPAQAALRYGPSLLLGFAIGGPVGAATMVGIQETAEETKNNLPEGTPDVVKKAVEYSIYGAPFGKGSAVSRLLQATRFGTTIAVGGEAAQLAGAPPVIGELTVPIIFPGMSALVRRQFAMFAAKASSGSIDNATLNAVLKKAEVKLEPNDVGKHVVFGNQLGVITSFAGRDLLNVTLDNGLQVVVRQADILPMQMGFGATVKSEAARLKAGLGIGANELPVMTTPSALAEMPVGRVMVHFTPEGNAASILREGFRPSRANTLDLPGVYVVPPENKDLRLFGRIFGNRTRAASAEGLPAEGNAVFAEVPNGPIATYQEALETMRSMGMRPGDVKSIGRNGMQEVVDALKQKGFIGAEWGELGGIVIFDAQAVKPRLAATMGQSWDDFMDFARGVMDGTAHVALMPDVVGGALIPGLSAETNELISHVTNNSYDRQIWQMALAGGAKPKDFPKTWLGQRWLTVRSAIGYNPGLRRYIQSQFLSAASLSEMRRIDITIKTSVAQKALREAFSKPVIEAMERGELPLASHYIGPAKTGRFRDSVIGSLGDAVEHPEFYTLTQTQRDVLQLYSSLMTNNAIYLRDVLGLSQELIEGAYAPHLYEKEAQTFVERFLSPAIATTRARGGPARPFFRQERATRDLREYADALGEIGEFPELNLFKLLDARLQASANLEADQAFLQGVANAYGVRIETSAVAKAAAEKIAKTQADIRTRLTTAIRQETRAITQREDVQRFDTLLRSTEDDLARLDERLASQRIGLLPVKMLHDTFKKLEGRVQALEGQANKIANAGRKLEEAALATEARLPKTQAAIDALRTHLRELRDNMPGPATAPPGWVEIGVGRLPHRTAVPEDVAREVHAIMAPQMRGEIVAHIEGFQQWLRSHLLSLDGSFFSKQGYDLWTLDPVKGISRVAESAMLATSREGFVTWAAQNYETLMRYTRAGGTFFMSATDAIKSLERGKSFRLPLAATLDEYGFHRFLPVLKVMQWQSQVQLLTNLQRDKAGFQAILEHLPGGGPVARLARRVGGVENASIEDIERAAADVIADVGGGINWAKLMTRPDLIQGSVFLTPGWLRANIGRIVNAGRVGDPRGVLARRFFFQNIAATAMLSTAASMALSGRLPTYDPTAGDFLDIQVGPTDEAGKGGSIPILPDKSYVRTIFRAIAGQGEALGEDPFTLEANVPAFLRTGETAIDSRVGAILSLPEGRLAQVPRLGIDLATGKDIFGRKIDNKLLYAARSFLPIAGQGLLDYVTGEMPDPTSAAVGLIGLNWVPKNPYEVRDAFVANGEYRDPVDGQKLLHYGDFTDSQRAAFDEQHPEYTQNVHKYQEERDSPYAVLRGIRDEHRLAIEVLGKVFRDQPISDSERALLGPEGADIERVKGNTTLYRNWLGSLAGLYREKSNRASQGQADFAPTTAAQKIVTGYYKEVIDASLVAGALDYTLLDANERSYRRQVEEEYGDAGLSALDAELLYRTTDDPVAQAYHKDQTLWEPYFNYLDAFWTEKNLVTAGMSPTMAATAAAFPNKERYAVWLTNAYFEQLVGKPLLDNIYNFRTSASGKTIGERWGIQRGRRLTEQQAQDIGEELTRERLEEYNKRVGNASDAYLKKENDVLCAMSYWGIKEPTEATRPYLVLCPVKEFAR